MDPAQRERVRDDLKGIVRGELLFDDLSRALYSTDASVFEVEPLGVVVPRDAEDVQALVRYAREHQASLIARGAGSGVAGESLGPGLVVDLSKHFRSIVEVGADTVRVQPGVTLRDLSMRLASDGRRLAPDPAHLEATVGGLLATNASGARALRHGYLREHVSALEVVLDSGDRVSVSRQSRWPAAEGEQRRLDDIVTSVVTLLEQNRELIRTARPATPFNRCGYLLHDVLDEQSLDLARLLVGSEGTLALFTEATLRTVPLPGGRAVVLLGFDSLDAALKGSRLALATEPVACDLIDRRLLRLARSEPAPLPLSPQTEAVLLVEYEGDTLEEVRRSAERVVEAARRAERPALWTQSAVGDEDAERLWQVREGVLPGLYALRGGAQPVAFVEDVGVPVEALPAYLYRVQELLQRREVTATFLIHAGTGQVHMRPFVDLRNREEGSRMWSLADEVYNIVRELGGTISTQHGTGLARSPWVEQQYGNLALVFRELKAIFDPGHIFNPGKITGRSPGVPLWPLRRRDFRAAPDPSPPEAEAAERQELPVLHWEAGEMAGEVVRCNGCGSCRVEAPGLRMCPLFRVSHDEQATPRAKANLMRHLLQGGTDPRLLSSEEVRAVADLCINCKMCAVECPAHVRIPKLMLEAKAANAAQHGLDGSDWALSRTETFARIGSAIAPIANAMLGNRLVRWVLERFFGISRQRRLPKFAWNHFLRQARRRGWTRKPRAGKQRVAYFVDIFATYNDPTIAEAVVAVLHHNGIEVYVPPEQRGCGMAPLACGDVETAREAIQHNLRILADLAREGYPILCSEPTAAVVLRQDALDLLDDPDAKLVAEHTVEFTSYLWDLHLQGRLRTDFRTLDYPIGHHVPCHLKALGQPPAGPSLLALIPGLRVRTIDVSCSGMAGTYGLRAESYATSLEAGRPLLEELAHPRVLFGSTECSTCRLQMEDGAGKRTLHPAQYLALAYGFLPELIKRLHTPLGDLVL
jgi:FAD/FMN-containing dehydrogenase/Fe-S oxidoreductase